MNELENKAKTVNSYDDLKDFLSTYVKDFQENGSGWENSNLETFLEGLSSWTEDMDGFYMNTGKKMSDLPDWQMVADMLMGARI
ncbi:MAG: hypothetical protein PF692_07835 [Kiritimatiellae bacterium]|jgi:hypothetical protein|nr:hypothetical protein [Kiritimatiellia bacterium]